MNTRDAGLIALGFIAGVAAMSFGLAAAMAQIEHGKSVDAMLQALAARSWKIEKR